MTQSSSRLSRRDLLQVSAALSGLAVGTTMGFNVPLARAAKPLRWGSASPGASGYIIIEALASTVSRNSDVKGSAISTGGAAENMALLGTKEIDLGQTTSWSWGPASRGEAPFKQKITPSQLLSYAIWSLHPIVLASSNIRTLDDLKGKRVSPGPAGGVTALVWKVLFEKAGLADKVKWSYGGWRESYDALKAGSIDCTGTVLVAGKPGGALAELSTTHKLRLLEIDPAVFKAVRATNPGALTLTLTPDNWTAVDKPIDAISVGGVLGAVADLPADTAYTIVKTIYENEEAIRKISPVLSLIRKDFATKFLMDAFPVNAGAARYFKETGLWRDDLKVQA